MLNIASFIFILDTDSAAKSSFSYAMLILRQLKT